MEIRLNLKLKKLIHQADLDIVHQTNQKTLDNFKKM